MFAPKKSWLEEDNGDLQVFVPGLMASGILVSIGMLVWDGIKRLIPDVGEKARAARLAQRAKGRVSDLNSVLTGEVPKIATIARVPRRASSALTFALATFAGAALITYLTLVAYNADEGTLAGRGWTLSAGLGLAVAVAALGVTWVLVAAYGDRQPSWLQRTHQWWPVGTLPDPDQHFDA